jgi:DNA-binding GntR family transcriptional regulator
MSIPLKRQGLVAADLYDLVVSAEPLDLDSSAVASLADKAYVAIRDRLIMLDIRPGDPIDDDELAKDLGVGRTPVREALKRLEGDHLDVTEIDRTELMRWDLAVHRAIYRAAGNPHLEDVLIRYDNLATRIFCLFLDRLPTVDEHVGEHVELLRAIAAGDAERADDLAREHVLGFERAIRAVI